MWIQSSTLVTLGAITSLTLTSLLLDHSSHCSVCAMYRRGVDLHVFLSPLASGVSPIQGVLSLTFMNTKFLSPSRQAVPSRTEDRPFQEREFNSHQLNHVPDSSLDYSRRLQTEGFWTQRLRKNTNFVDVSLLPYMFLNTPMSNIIGPKRTPCLGYPIYRHTFPHISPLDRVY